MSKTLCIFTYVKALAFQNHNLCKKRHWHWILHLTTSLTQRHSLYMHIYVLIMKQLLLADEVVVNSTKLFWFQHFFCDVDHFDDICGSSQVPFQPQSWQLCRWPMSGDTGPQLQWCDTIWHWKRPQGAQQIDTQYPPLTHIHLDDGSCNLCTDDKQCHTHT